METGLISPYSPNRASPRSGRERASSILTGGAEPLQEVEGDGPAQSLQAEPSLPRSGMRRATSVPTAPTEPIQEVEGDGPAQSLQPQHSLSQKWKETVQLSPYSPNRASPRSGRRRASSVLTGGAENLQVVEGDGPAQSLQAEPSLSKKWKETGQLSPYRRNRVSPRSGRRRASSVPLAPTEPFPEVEGDRPAQSLQPQQSLSKKWKETASSVPTAPTEPLQEVEGDGPAQTLQAEPSLSQKWKETGQLSPSSPNRAFPRSGRRPSSSVPTAPTEPLQEVEGDGPAQSLQPQQSLSQKWKETGQLSPYRRSRASPRSGRRRASSVLTAPTEPLPVVEGDGPAQSLQPNRASPRSGRRRASSVPTAPNEPLQEVGGDGPAQSLQP